MYFPVSDQSVSFLYKLMEIEKNRLKHPSKFVPDFTFYKRFDDEMYKEQLRTACWEAHAILLRTKPPKLNCTDNYVGDVGETKVKSVTDHQ